MRRRRVHLWSAILVTVTVIWAGIGVAYFVGPSEDHFLVKAVTNDQPTAEAYDLFIRLPNGTKLAFRGMAVRLTEQVDGGQTYVEHLIVDRTPISFLAHQMSVETSTSTSGFNGQGERIWSMAYDADGTARLRQAFRVPYAHATGVTSSLVYEGLSHGLMDSDVKAVHQGLQFGGRTMYGAALFEDWIEGGVADTFSLLNLKVRDFWVVISLPYPVKGELETWQWYSLDSGLASGRHLSLLLPDGTAYRVELLSRPVERPAPLMPHPLSFQPTIMQLPDVSERNIAVAPGYSSQDLINLIRAGDQRQEMLSGYLFANRGHVHEWVVSLVGDDGMSNVYSFETSKDEGVIGLRTPVQNLCGRRGVAWNSMTLAITCSRWAEGGSQVVSPASIWALANITMGPEEGGFAYLPSDALGSSSIAVLGFGRNETGGLDNAAALFGFGEDSALHLVLDIESGAPTSGQIRIAAPTAHVQPAAMEPALYEVPMSDPLLLSSLMILVTWSTVGTKSLMDWRSRQGSR